MNRVFPTPEPPEPPRRRRRKKAEANGQAAPPPGPPGPQPPPVTSAADLKSQKLHWLYQPWILLEALTVLEGRKGDGKSCLLAALAAYVTGGPRLPGATATDPASVLWFAGEEHLSAETKPKLAAAGADLSRVIFPGVDRDGHTKGGLSLPRDLRQLKAWIEQFGARLVVLDPMPSFISSGLSLNSEQDVRSVLEPLRDVMVGTAAACMLGRHVRKSHRGDARDQGMGSGAIGNLARAVLRVSREKPGGSRILLSVVSKNLGKRPRSLVYELEDAGGMPRVAWKGESALTTDELSQEPEDPGQKLGREDVKKIILAELAGGEKPCKDVLRVLADSDLRGSLVHRARADLGVETRQVCEGPTRYWVWSLPPATGQA